MKTLPRHFLERDTPTVARELLGKVLVHRTNEGIASGRIVEVEAYLGKGDPASRASRKRTRLNEIMWGPGGKAFVYVVHGHCLFNVTTEQEGKPGAVLIRALEPIGGIEFMRRRRRVSNPEELASGPGKLTEALGITREHHGLDLTNPEAELAIVEGEPDQFEVACSHRTGVSADLPQKLRFYVKNSTSVSRRGSHRSRGTPLRSCNDV